MHGSDLATAAPPASRLGAWAPALLVALALAASVAFAQAPAPTAKPPAAKPPAAKPPATKPAAKLPPPNPDSVVATVGSLRISRAEFESRYARQAGEYSARSGSELAAEFVPIARRQVLEGLIQRELLRLEAERRGLLATVEEAEQEMKRDPFFQSGGVFNAAKYDAIRTTQPQQFASAVQQIRVELGARTLQQKLDREFALPEAELRATAERELSRAAISYLALRRVDFSGRYAEPREADILAEYRARRSTYTRPDRARLTIAFLNTPTLSEADRADPAKVRAWTERLKGQAQDALAAVKGGETLEDATGDFGAPRRDILVTRDNFPGYWRGGERLNSMLFALPPGSVLPEPVPADFGWLLVRVEERTPSYVAPLREVAGKIRADLRERAQKQSEDDALRPVYQRMRDSLRTTGYRVRYALADTAAVTTREPSAAELERYYRAHLADYSAFDAATTSVRARPFDEVKAEVRRRVMSEQRVNAAREIIAGIAAAWRQGKRDRALESRATLLREVGPVLLGRPADQGAVGRVLGDSLSRRAGALGVGTGPTYQGLMVFHVYEVVPGYIPSFEQARDAVAARQRQEREREEEQGARQLFDQDPMRFRGPDVMHLTRVSVSPPDILDIPLTRAEVERYHQEHMDRYSAPEMVRARHILISPNGPGPEADEKARARAADVLRRIRAGEDFAALARQFSDDPPTREQGGELGSFARGAMLEEFERAAFALKEGEVSDLVRTKEGYHIIQCISRESAVAQPLAWMYGNVAADLALERVEKVAKTRADSIYLVAGTPAKLRVAAKKLKLSILPMEHKMGDRSGLPFLVDVLTALEGMKPGQMYPGPHKSEGKDYAFSWLDSIVPARKPTWEDAQDQAIQAYREGAGQRALTAKLAELDSLGMQGIGLDSLAAYWGGLDSIPALERGKGLPHLGGAAQIDSLAFGGSRPAALNPGQVSGWQSLSSAVARVRLDRRAQPDPAAVATRVEADRRKLLDQKLHGYFEDLKRRYPVKILDPGLKDVGLPEPSQQ
jgi:parvulin-like peptidyl-prolyl isomerase